MQNKCHNKRETGVFILSVPHLTAGVPLNVHLFQEKTQQPCIVNCNTLEVYLCTFLVTVDVITQQQGQRCAYEHQARREQQCVGVHHEEL